jgi:hypothetical protein
MKNYFEKNEYFESVVSGKHQKINSKFSPIGRVDSRNPTILAIAFKVKD